MDLTQQLSNLYRDAPVSFSFTGKGKLGVDTYSFNVLIESHHKCVFGRAIDYSCNSGAS